jgi:beta-galactosidase
MEQAPGTLADRGALVSKAPGRLARLSASNLARGSRGVMFFQWRASAAGAEQYHSAIVPHAGPRSRIFAEATELGAVLPRLAEADAGTVHAEVAIAWDAPSWWALQAPHLPSDRLDYLAALRRAHRALWRRQVTVDFVDLADLGPGRPAYKLVLVPSHYLAGDAVAESVERYVAGGGALVVWYFSGVADEHGRVRLGGYPGAFREVLGVRVTEFHPLPPGSTVRLSHGGQASDWCEHVELAGAEAVRWYANGGLAGRPAVTRHAYRNGVGWYVSTELPDGAYASLLDGVLADAGVVTGDLPPGVEVVRRSAGEVGWLFVLNHTDAPVRVPARGVELVSGARVDGELGMAPGGYAVVRSGPGPPGR